MHMELRLGKHEDGATGSEMMAPATFVVESASGVAVPVTEPLKPAEIEALKRETSPDVISKVAEARDRLNVA